jgi:hypothetical protein
MSSRRTKCGWSRYNNQRFSAVSTKQGSPGSGLGRLIKTFPDSSIGAVHRAPGDFPAGKQGHALTVEFTVMGIPCLGLNGGQESECGRSPIPIPLPPSARSMR